MIKKESFFKTYILTRDLQGITSTFRSVDALANAILERILGIHVQFGNTLCVIGMAKRERISGKHFGEESHFTLFYNNRSDIRYKDLPFVSFSERFTRTCKSQTVRRLQQALGCHPIYTID